jgi:hypothetical protein
MSQRTPSGFSSRRYTLSDVFTLCAAGAWFDPKKSYDFENLETACFASEATEFFTLLDQPCVVRP